VKSGRGRCPPASRPSAGVAQQLDLRYRRAVGDAHEFCHFFPFAGEQLRTKSFVLGGQERRAHRQAHFDRGQPLGEPALSRHDVEIGCFEHDVIDVSLAPALT
jgi:hypothetical protein